MTVEQWGIRVPLGEGEPVRQALIREGALDPALKPCKDGGALLLPVLAWREGAIMCGFEPLPDRPELPRHELVGGIAIMQDCDVAGAAQVLASRPSLHTVLYATSEVSGEYRTRDYKVLAGTLTTRTQVTEHGHRFTVDLAGAYFSARLSTERNRILQQMGKNELVLDMFAGVGPFAISLAARAALV
ncbi:MAG: methyltransferase, partial [Methanoregula sp.]